MSVCPPLLPTASPALSTGRQRWCAGPKSRWGAAAVALAMGCTTNLDAAQMTQVDSVATAGAADVDIAPTPMRRLTHSEYNHTVQALLGTQRSPAEGFPADPVADGFDNSGEAQVLTSTDLDAHFLAASQLAQEATTAGNLPTLAPCAEGEAPQACLTKFVATFGLRAWRRPLSEEDQAGLTALAASLPGASYGDQIAALVMAFLISPNFIFLSDPQASSADSPQAHGAYALASQLSYFLWSGPPDDKLMAAAADGSIVTDAGLAAQAERMLADPRASALVDDFAAQWMQLRQVSTFVPDPSAFPKWTPSLRDAMLTQSHMTLADLMGGKTSMTALLTGESTYLSRDLAAYYGLPAVASANLVAVTLAAGSRRGLLGQGAILTNSSFPRRTSLTRRGKFVLDQLLCAPIPPPPNNVPALADSGDPVGSQRTIMAAHITNPSCAVCHKNLDPYGYVLESFDAVGASRTLDNSFPIDTHADLPDGAQVATLEELEAHLAGDPRVAACTVEKLYTYALGRSVSDNDQQQLAGLVDTFVSQGQIFPPLLAKLVLSNAFRYRRSP